MINKLPEEDLLQLNQLMWKTKLAQYEVDVAFLQKKNLDLEYENLLLRTYLKHELTSDYIIDNATGEVTLKKKEDKDEQSNDEDND